MPRKNPDGSRDYSYDSKYEASKVQREHRAERVHARYELSKEGKVHKGDGMDVDHVKPLKNGGSNSPSNWQVITKKANRSKKPE